MAQVLGAWALASRMIISILRPLCKLQGSTFVYQPRAVRLTVCLPRLQSLAYVCAGWIAAEIYRRIDGKVFST